MAIQFGTTNNDNLFGQNGNDILQGNSGDDTISGGIHDDVLEGGTGDDLLQGGLHDDLLNGNSGNDSLIGEVGSDTLIGGDGADSFIFTSLDSLDAIADFNSSQGDKIIFDIFTTGVSNIRDLRVHIGSSYLDTSDRHRVTSIYVDGERIIEFDAIITLQVEDFEFI